MGEIVAAIAPFAVAGSILPTWTIIVIGLLGTERPIANALAFVGGNALFRIVLGVVLVLFASVLPDSTSLRLDSGGFDPLVPLGTGVALIVLGGFVWTRPAAAQGTTLIDRAERIHPWLSFLAGLAAVAAPGVQYAYFVGGLAAVVESVPGTTARLAAMLAFVAVLQWMLLMPLAIYLMFRSRAERLLERIKAWLKANSRKLGGGILVAIGLYLAVFGVMELVG